MGCDGGTIPKRSEVVKVKQKEQKLDETTIERIRWAVCALSQQPLREPVVADELGHVMSREAVLEALVNKSMPKNFKHIRSLKDIIALKLEKNPNFSDGQKSDRDESYVAAFICPISQLETNGRYRFCCIRKCGHVLSEKAIKEVPSSNCLVCQSPYSTDDIIQLNPSAEVLETVKQKIEQRKALQKAKKAAESDDKEPPARKRKSPSSAEPSSSAEQKTISLPSSVAVEMASTMKAAASAHDAMAQKSDVYRSLFSSEKRQKVETANGDAFLIRSARAYV